LKSRDTHLKNSLHATQTIASCLFHLNNKIVSHIQTRVTSAILGANNWWHNSSLEGVMELEKYFFENNICEYSEPNEKERNKLLVERVESIVSSDF
jgi:hypothetical protein